GRILQRLVDPGRTIVLLTRLIENIVTRTNFITGSSTCSQRVTEGMELRHQDLPIHSPESRDLKVICNHLALH
ncbi:MAG: hypothetical protein ABW109_19865, partial [Candidatus Thiodiazotropha sp. 6PLUC4]